MFEPRRDAREKLNTYIGARVTETEEAWLMREMERRRMSMSDLIRLGLSTLTRSNRKRAEP